MQIPLRQPRVTLPVPDSSTPQLGGGRLELDVLAREYTLDTLGGTRQQLRAVTIFLVNRRASTRRRYEDLSYAFQARIELGCLDGILPRHDLSGYRLDDEDVRIADLHYRDVAEFAVGRSTSAAWGPEADGKVMAAWTDPRKISSQARLVWRGCGPAGVGPPAHGATVMPPAGQGRPSETLRIGSAG